MKPGKYILIVFLIGFFSFSISGIAQGINPEEKKVEISHKELPTGARTYITDNFPGAEILKAFKVLKEDKVSGYLVMIKQDGEEKSIYYDKQGLAKNDT